MKNLIKKFSSRNKDKTLSWFGKGICFILDKLDKNHCKKSINNFNNKQINNE